MSASHVPQGPASVEEFPPTLREVMLRPRWMGVLLLCLVVAGVFAWLGQWQLSRAIDTSPPPPGMTEEVKPLTEVVEPGRYLAEPLVGQRVQTQGSWVPGDFLVVSSRFNDGVQGYWVTGQLRIAADGADAAPRSVAVAVGWAPDVETAKSAITRLEADADGSIVDVAGRLISDEGPAVPPHDDPTVMTRMSPAALLSWWHDIDGVEVYRQYIAATTTFGGLDDIASPAPDEMSPVNWLNIFYAAEWAIFAGFAFYLWYRLARDAWERDVEEFEDAAASR